MKYCLYASTTSNDLNSSGTHFAKGVNPKRGKSGSGNHFAISMEL